MLTQRWIPQSPVRRNPVTNPPQDPCPPVCPDECQFWSSRFTSQKIKTHRMSYLRRKPSRLLETDAAPLSLRCHSSP